MKLNGKLIDALAILIFIGITVVFFGRLYTGDMIVQSDIQQYKGMSKEIIEYKENGELVHWTNQAFGGMPTYLLGNFMYQKNNLPYTINSFIGKLFPGFTELLLIGLVSFYILMRAMNINRWLSIIGSFCFALGTFVTTSLLAGHNTKINAYAYAPLIIAGLVYIFKRRPWLGVLCLGYGLAAQIAVNHLQITFYTFLVCLIFVIAELIRRIKEKDKSFWKPIVLAAIGVIIGVGVNFNKLYTIYQHAEYTTRSGDSLQSEINSNTETKGADYDYATQWSYTPLESFTLLIPNFMGGASNEKLGEKSSWYGNQQLPRYYQTNPPTYWGQMPFTSGPVYLGAVLFALFFFGLQYTKSRWKWWVIAASILLLFLSWGKFFPVYDAFYYGFPFFDKFRTPMMALLMLGLTIPLLSFKGTHKAIFGKKTTITNQNLLIGFGIPIGLILLFGLLGANMYSFKGAVDQSLEQAGLPSNLIKLLRSDRKMLLTNDSFRSLVFVLLTAASFWAFAKEKIKVNLLLILLALLCFFDLYTANKRYLNNDLYTSKTEYQQEIKASSVDKAIKEDQSYYRVFDITRNPFTNALTSLQHKSLGGYHAAKLQIYQDLIDFKLSQNDQNALNMLNAKYFIGQGENGQIGYEKNENAMGNAWFVDEVVIAASPKEAMTRLNEINVSDTAIVESIDITPQDLRFSISESNERKIDLVSYHPEKMVYQANSDGQNNFAVFSEIFYRQNDGDGWHAYIDGREVPIYKTNYLLRGIEIPEGDHKVVFEYQKTAFKKRGLVSRTFSGLLFLVAVGFLANVFLNRKNRIKARNM